MTTYLSVQILFHKRNLHRKGINVLLTVNNAIQDIYHDRIEPFSIQIIEYCVPPHPQSTSSYRILQDATTTCPPKRINISFFRFDHWIYDIHEDGRNRMESKPRSIRTRPIHLRVASSFLSTRQMAASSYQILSRSPIHPH